ncbi:MAG: hypothetical protein GX801_08535 [Fibrobacter sp.]|nr:hypothetical protein [Fibrobacter sp.]
MDFIEKIEDEIAVLKVEHEKFQRGNMSAGTRARKNLQNIKKLSQAMRVQIQDKKKNKP